MAFLVFLFFLFGAAGGYLYWQQQQKIEDWGLRIELGPMNEQQEAFCNQFLDQEGVLLNAIQKHDLKSYYGLSSNDEIVARLREDSFARLWGEKSLDILFKGQRKTRKEREAVVKTLSESLYQYVQSQANP